MRHILVIIALIVTVWAFLPGAAQAHDMPHAEMGSMAMDGDCANCPGMDTAGGHGAGMDCHHGTGCGPAAHVLPTAHLFAVERSATRSRRPDDAMQLGSVFLTRDLPPPRS